LENRQSQEKERPFSRNCKRIREHGWSEAEAWPHGNPSLTEMKFSSPEPEKASAGRSGCAKPYRWTCCSFSSGLLFIRTRSCVVFARFVAAYPLAFVVHAFLAWLFATCIRQRKSLLRRNTTGWETSGKRGNTQPP